MINPNRSNKGVIVCVPVIQILHILSFISLYKTINDGQIHFIICFDNIPVKPIAGHPVQVSPVGPSDGTREILDLRENIIGELHCVNKNI